MNFVKISLLAFVFFIYTQGILAANPNQPFLPSDNILDPGCTPLDSNCYVLLTSFKEENITGLDYSTTTGVLSLTSGYTLPLIASTTEWIDSINTLNISTIKQGGNSFGTTTILGTNDSNSLILKTNNTTRLTIDSAGVVNIPGTLTLGTQLADGQFVKSGDWTGIFDGREGSYYLDRANHTGLQLSSTILDFSTSTRSSISSSITGIGYSTTTGIFSLNAGYEIPSIASTTAWNNVTLSITQGGNSFGTSTVLGTNDNNALVFKTNSTQTGYISADGLSIGLGLGAGTGGSLVNTFFVGNGSGNGATNATSSNFMGLNAGSGAIGAAGSNFLGLNAGQNATGTYQSNFLGINAGFGATGSYQSNFIGAYSGSGATGSFTSNYFGYNSGFGATNAKNSNFIGNLAGQGATSANHSTYIGTGAGLSAGVNYGTFIGYYAGQSATGAANSVFIGGNAGQNATNANSSNFIGSSAGTGATNANNSNFIGSSAGTGATSANNSNFLGQNAGNGATGANNSNFLGQRAGFSATSAYTSNFIGYYAGQSATNAANAIFIGTNSGNSDNVNNTSGNKYSILIGNNTKTGGFSNSIAIGQGVSNSAIDQLNIGRVIYATNIGSSTTATSSEFALSMVGIGTSTPQDKLQIFGDVRLGTTGTNGCIKNYAGTGLTGTCSSDERLKTNIVDLSDGYLDKLVNLKVITYNWNDQANSINRVDTSIKNYGLLAQNVEALFPELVSTDSNGYKQVDYSRLPLYLLKSVQELSKKVFAFADLFITKELRTNKLCVEDVCVTKEEFKQMLLRSNVNYTIVQNETVVTPTINTDQESESTVEAVTVNEPVQENTPVVTEPVKDIPVETAPTPTETSAAVEVVSE